MGAAVLHTSTARRRSPRLADPARPARRKRHRLAAPAADRPDRGLINAAALALMKPEAVLVNTVARTDRRRGRAGRRAAQRAPGRGRPGRVRRRTGPADNPLLALDNVVLTPHVTWYTVDTMRRYLTEAVDNCRRMRDGRTW